MTSSFERKLLQNLLLDSSPPTCLAHWFDNGPPSIHNISISLPSFPTNLAPLHKSPYTPHDRKQILNSLTKKAITAMLPTSGHFDGLRRNLSLQLKKFSHSLLCNDVIFFPSKSCCCIPNPPSYRTRREVANFFGTVVITSPLSTHCHTLKKIQRGDLL